MTESTGWYVLDTLTGVSGPVVSDQDAALRMCQGLNAAACSQWRYEARQGTPAPATSDDFPFDRACAVLVSYDVAPHEALLLLGTAITKGWTWTMAGRTRLDVNFDPDVRDCRYFYVQVRNETGWR